MSLATMARRTSLAAAAFLAIGPGGMAAASDYVETEALFHARAIEEAWDTLATHIATGSTAAVSWTGTTPPASTGWLADWTQRGLGARYCDSVLLVYARATTMKGVGTNLGAVQLAPHLEAKSRNRDVPPLHWLDGGTAEGVLGRGTVTLPACMGAAPSARPALAGPVVDPFTVSTSLVTAEHQSRACPAGFHGTGQTFVRQVTQQLNGRGDPAGAPATGPWTLLVDHCRADTVSWEYVRQSCTFTPGAPHVGTLTGEAVWRRQKRVTAAGTSYGPPQFVSTTCWTDPNPTPPTPREWTSTTTETRPIGCGTGYTGSRTQRRTITWRHLQWPWDASATVQRISQTGWATSANSCRKIPDPPPPADPPQDPPPEEPEEEKEKDDTPKDDTPKDDTPKDDTPKDDTPKDDTPKDDTPKDDTPKDDTPKDDTPKDDTPKDDTPKDDTPEKEQSNEEGGDRDGGGNGGGGVGGGWDTDGDGKADVEHSSQLDADERKSADYVQGHTPIGRDGKDDGGDRSAPDNGNDGNSGGNGCGCGGPGGGGPGDAGGNGGGNGGGGNGPGGNRGSGDRGR